MKSVSKIFQVLLLIMSFAAATYAGETSERPLSLAEALEIGQQQGYAVLIARAQLSEAKGQSLEAWSGFLPRLTLSETYIKTNEPVSVFGLKLKQGVFSQQDFALPALNNPAKFENYTGLAKLEVPLLNLDAVFGKAAAVKMVSARKAGLKRAGQVLTHYIRAAYYGLLLSRQNLQAIRAAVASAETHRDNARAAYQEGLISRADFLAAEVRLAELLEQEIMAGNQVHQVNDGLKLLLGVADAVVFVPTDSMTVPMVSIDSENPFIALGERADLAAFRFQEQAARRNLWAVRGRWMPRVNAFGLREWNGAEAFRDNSNNWTVGVQLSWNVFDGFGHWGRSKQAAAKLSQVRYQHSQARQQAENEVAAAMRNIRAARQRIKVAEGAVQQARESLNIVEARFREGLEKTSELLDKEVMFTNAKLRLLKAVHDYNLALSEYELASGAKILENN